MFYIPEILARKGPLSIVWLAAHFDKKISKNQIMAANITDIIDMVTNSNIKISLRITCDLIIGICKINKFQNKYLLDESQHWTTQVEMLAGKFDFKKKTNKTLTKTVSIDLPDISDSFTDLNIPEIFDYVNLNLPGISFPVTLPRKSITLQEIPPLTEEEKKIEEEIEKQIYDLDDQVTFDSVEEFFEDILPAPQAVEPSTLPPPPEEPMAIEDVPYTTIVTPPPAPLLSDTKEESISKKRIQDVKTSSVEKRRKIEDISNLGSLELVPLDESSIRTRKPFPASDLKSKFKRRRHHITYDVITKIPNNVMVDNQKKTNVDTIVPDIFIPSTKLITKSLFTDPFRFLSKDLRKWFIGAFNNDPFIEEQVTTIEPAGEELSADEEFFNSSLLPIPQDSIIDQPPPLMDEDPLPTVRGIFEGDTDQQLPGLSEFTITDRSIVEEQLNLSLQNLFSRTEILTFDQLSIPENKKSSAALFFYNLLEMKNNEKIDLKQDPSYDQFNPIYIIQIN